LLVVVPALQSLFLERSARPNTPAAGTSGAEG
jgi:hypothetical protein